MKKIGIMFVSLAMAGLFVSMPLQASAASNSLGVNPRRDYVISPGESKSDTLFVSNLSKTDELVVGTDIVDFGPKDETGSPVLMLAKDQPTRWSLKPYVEIVGEQTIAPGKSAEIPFTITIPAKTGAGSYYGAVKYTAGGEAGDENVSLASSSATLMFVRVPGEAKSSLRLEQFGAFTPNSDATSGNFGSLYIGEAPKFLAYRVKNQGNVAEQPAGSTILRDTFGKQVNLVEDVNPNKNIVLIDQTRRFDLCLNVENISRKDPETGRNIEETKCNKFSMLPGRYTADLTLLYGDNGNASQEMRSSASFWYLPIWFLVITALAAALLIGGVLYAIKKIKSGGKIRSGGRR